MNRSSRGSRPRIDVRCDFWTWALAQISRQRFPEMNAMALTCLMLGVCSVLSLLGWVGWRFFVSPATVVKAGLVVPDACSAKPRLSRSRADQPDRTSGMPPTGANTISRPVFVLGAQALSPQTHYARGKRLALFTSKSARASVRNNFYWH